MPKSAESSSRSQLVRVLARLLTAHPGWVLAHAQGYVDLGLEQAQLGWAAWQRRVALWLLAAASGALGLIFVGVGTMLWAISPELAAHRLWVLALVPLLPLLGAATFVLLARAVQRPPGLLGIQQQWNADLDVLRQVSTPVAPSAVAPSAAAASSDAAVPHGRQQPPASATASAPATPKP